MAQFLKDNRFVSIIKNIFGAAAARGINLAITAFMVPLTLNSLTPAEYAILSMAISFSVLAGFADLGLGLSVVNSVSSAVDNNTTREAQEIVSTVWVILLGISTIGIILISLYLAVIFSFNITISNINLAILTAGFFIFLGLPAGIAQQLLFAMQKSYIANLWVTAGRVASLIWVWQVVVLSAENLFLLLFGVLGIPMLISWLSIAWLRKTRLLNALVITVKYFSPTKLISSIRTGTRYLVIQVAPYAETGIDVLLLGYFVGLSEVPAYDVHSKLFMYVVALMTMIISPVWPGLSSALATGDVQWTRRLVKVCIFGSPIFAFIFASTIGYFSETIISYWTGQNLKIATTILFGFIFFTVFASLGVAQSAILNAYSLIKRQSQLVGVYIILTILLKIWGAITFGPIGMIWALCILNALKSLIFHLLIINHGILGKDILSK